MTKMSLTVQKLVKTLCFIFVVASFISCIFLPMPSGCEASPQTSKNQSDLPVPQSDRRDDDNDGNFCDQTSNTPILQLVTRVKEVNGLTKNLMVDTKGANRAHKTVELNSTGWPIEVTCSSHYPIDFTFDGHVSNRDTTASDIVRIGQTCFSIKAKVEAFERVTGNYSCFSINDPKIRSSFYIFVMPSNPGSLLHRRQHLTIKPNLFDKVIQIPCPSSTRHVKVQLWKQTRVRIIDKSTLELQQWTHMDAASGARYDPKVGFSLKIQENVFGSYKCNTTALHSDDDDVYIKVDKPDGFQVYPPGNIVKLKENEKFTAKCEAKEEIQIKYENTNFKFTQNNQSVPQQKGREDEDEAWTKFSIEIQTESLKKNQIEGKISCHRTSDNLELHQWNILNASDTSGTKDGGVSPALENCHRGGGVIKYFPCTNWVECRLRQCQLADTECETNDFDYCSGTLDAGTHAIRKCSGSGILQCVPRDNQNDPSSTMIYFTGLKSHKRITDWKTVGPEDILNISLITQSNKKYDHIPHKFGDDDKSGSRDSKLDNRNMVILSCRGSSFVFSRHFRWTLLMKGEKKGNGPREIRVAQENVQHLWDKSREVLESLIQIEISDQVMEIKCHAPIWNSTEEKIMSLTRAEITELIVEQSPRSSGVRLYYLAFTTVSIIGLFQQSVYSA